MAAVRTASNSEMPQYPIGSVDSALRLLLMLRDRTQIRIADASEELGVARSTAHRLMQMLQYYGFVKQDPVSRAYIPGPVLLNLGLRAVRDLDIRDVARPFIQELVDEVDETVDLLVLEGTDALIVESIESSRALRIAGRTGSTVPAHASGGGRSLLAELSPARIRELYPHPRLERFTARTITTRKQLEKELEATRERGYSLNVGGLEPDISSIAAPIRDPTGHAAFAVSMALPSVRLPESAIPAMAKRVIKCAARIAEQLPW